MLKSQFYHDLSEWRSTTWLPTPGILLPSCGEPDSLRTAELSRYLLSQCVRKGYQKQTLGLPCFLARGAVACCPICLSCCYQSWFDFCLMNLNDK